jgi:deoxyadenosine/deoxycytidine kinase
MPTLISVEGNIGSGKSTLLRQLNDKFKDKRIYFLQEPVKEWDNIKNEENTTILEEFYKNKKKWAFSFQMMAYISRLKTLRDLVKKHGNDIIIISERSLWTDKNVFAKMLYDEKSISTIDYQIYNKWFDEFIEEFPLKGIIYLNTSPKICYERVKKRSRTGEETIALSYLEMCSQYHNSWIKNDKCQILEFIGDGSESINITPAWLKRIDSFIKSLNKNYSNLSYEDIINKMYC